MSRDLLPLHQGAIRANRIGSFVMGGESFHIIRPGYCTQGKRRLKWTQFVHDDVPIFEVKLQVDLDRAIAQFESQWKRTVGDDRELLARALENCKRERRRKFRDGVSGVAPAPSASTHDRSEGRRYTA